LTSGDVARLVENELRQITDLPLNETLQSFLVLPYRQIRKWDYSTTDEMLPCWIVADFHNNDLGLAYSPLGHGRRGDCWGVVKLANKFFGRDDSWFLVLEDAFINSGQWHRPLPDGYEIR